MNTSGIVQRKFFLVLFLLVRRRGPPGIHETFGVVGLSTNDVDKIVDRLYKTDLS